MPTKPTIACVFHQTAPLPAPPEALVAALQQYVDQHLGPVWAVAATLSVATLPGAGDWSLIFADDADQAGALGYHVDGSDGLPRGFVFVRTTEQDRQPVAEVASHELAEMLVDPGANLGAFTPRGRWAALEVADPVQDQQFPINGLSMSNFVYPAWFGQPGTQFDHLGKCSGPWQLQPGGYLPVFAGGRWTQIFGSREARQKWQARDPRGRRSSRRAGRRAPAGPAVV